MSLSTPDTVVLALLFIVPGFVCSTVISMLVPRRAASSQARLIEYFTWSCLNFALIGPIAIPVLYGLSEDRIETWHLPLLGIGLFIFLLALPAGLGLLAGWLSQKQYIALLLQKLGFSTIHPIPNAWDFQFSRELPCWMIVTLIDNQTVYGFFYENSFAGEAQDNRDLYLEKVYRLGDNEQWVAVQSSAGIWINESQIKAIEFIEYGEHEE